MDKVKDQAQLLSRIVFGRPPGMFVPELGVKILTSEDPASSYSALVDRANSSR